jgi:hypothetical protein
VARLCSECSLTLAAALCFLSVVTRGIMLWEYSRSVVNCACFFSRLKLVRNAGPDPRLLKKYLPPPTLAQSGYEHVYIRPDTGQRVQYPRKGSFEIIIKFGAGTPKLVHSKVSRPHRWPNPAVICQAIRDMIAETMTARMQSSSVPMLATSQNVAF